MLAQLSLQNGVETFCLVQVTVNGVRTEHRLVSDKNLGHSAKDLQLLRRVEVKVVCLTLHRADTSVLHAY